MRFSKTLNSPSYCIPSPDGRLLGALVSSSCAITVRSVQSGLDVVKDIKLPRDMPGPFISFQWSPSSRLLLVANEDQIRVYSAGNGSFQAHVKNLLASGGKPAHIGFGASDREICVCSAFGTKLVIFDLVTSKASEIADPKFYTPSTAARGLAFRPRSRHLALLTRSAGKDLISVHEASARKLHRSWAPDTIDAQSLMWSPDGKWLIICEAAAYGHKMVFYTADGHLFKTWSGPVDPPPEHKDFELGAGIKLAQVSADARYLAVGDSSRSLSVLTMHSVTQAARLHHPATVIPHDRVQVWVEQASLSQAVTSVHSFLRATQAVAPAVRKPKGDAETKTGCSSLSFDKSSSLLATRLAEFPSTAWIWDTAALELRAVLLFLNQISDLTWHPTISETLLIQCDGEQYSALVFVWDPLSQGPRPVDFGPGLPQSKGKGKRQCRWLGLENANPAALFFADDETCLLASLTDAEGGLPPWMGSGTEAGAWDQSSMYERGLEQQLPASFRGVQGELWEDDEDAENSEIEDTFVFKR